MAVARSSSGSVAVCLLEEERVRTMDEYTDGDANQAGSNLLLTLCTSGFLDDAYSQT